MFDLDSDPLLIANIFQSHKFLDSLWKQYPGLRIARGWDPFETAICTILGQLVSLSQGRTLVHQLVQSCGEKIVHPVTGQGAFLFPSPGVLAAADLQEVKTTQARKNTIKELSRRILRQELDLVTPQDADVAREHLESICGIGPWSAEYISLRALGNADAFPARDLILKRALAKHPDLNLDTIRPWRSYAAIYLWRHDAETLSKRDGAVIRRGSGGATGRKLRDGR